MMSGEYLTDSGKFPAAVPLTADGGKSSEIKSGMNNHNRTELNSKFLGG
jgi:hypothetical protein